MKIFFFWGGRVKKDKKFTRNKIIRSNDQTNINSKQESLPVNSSTDYLKTIHHIHIQSQPKEEDILRSVSLTHTHTQCLGK